MAANPSAPSVNGEEAVNAERADTQGDEAGQVDVVDELDLDSLEEGDVEGLEPDVFDFSTLNLKDDHRNRPLWVCPNGSVFLETYSPIYKQAYDFLIAVAEPQCRPEAVHEYLLSQHSLYAAVSIGLSTETIISVLNRLSKVELAPQVCQFIQDSTENFGKVKLVLDQSRFYVESPHPDILKYLMSDTVIQDALTHGKNTPLRTGRGLLDDVVIDLAMTGIQQADGGRGHTGAVPSQPATRKTASVGTQQDAEDEGPLDEEMEAALEAEAAGPPGAAAAGTRPTVVEDEGPLDEEMEAAFDALPSRTANGNRGLTVPAEEGPLEEELEATFGEERAGVRVSQDGNARQASVSSKVSMGGSGAVGRTEAAARPMATSDAAAGTSSVEGGRRNVGVQDNTDGGSGAWQGERGDTYAGTAPEAQQVYSFEVRPDLVERVKERCLPSGLNYPMLEEYDFRNDSTNPDVAFMDLKPTVRHRPYQEKGLAKMFGNGRARSGIVVLPCGAGKTLVGISAAQRIRKSCLCLVTNSVSVDQWHNEFRRWTTLEDKQLMRFTANIREELPQSGQLDVCITTYNMVAYNGRRSEQSKKIMQAITSQDWGLLLMDEVHVVPAQMFRKVVGVVKSHCKLGLTATLVREDSLIKDLNFLIGPKLYEANWLDLARDGHIANVQSNEVWCPMQKEFFREYLKPDNSSLRQLLYVLNPNKFQACQWLMEYHELVRGDKIIVFSDNLFALREYASRLKRPFICGATSHADRTRILYNFKNNPQVNTIFLSKVGDNSIDIPEANVLLQISSHAGSRRQEAQRLGRILRAKRTRQGADPKEHNAFFYTIVSQDTQEMYYSTKRQQFLVDQGYAFKVITNLLDGAGSAQLQLSSHNEQLNLLAKILSTAVEDAHEAEEAPGGGEDAGLTPAAAVPRAKARRVMASLSTMSGAEGRLYMEYSTAAGDK